MNRPVGTVTFLFTDVEGSTRAWEAHPAETQTALKRHDEILAREIEAYNGALILERGEGDSVFAVFARAADAVAAAVEIQRALRAQTWPTDVPMRVRMSITLVKPALTMVARTLIAPHVSARLHTASRF